MTRARLYGLLVLFQMAHSCEEYAGRLYENFPPARFVSGLFSSDLRLGFVIFNAAFDLFGIWCWLVPVRRGRPWATPLMWVWVTIETLNGIGHPIWSLMQGGYTPGVITAPFLLVAALALSAQLRRTAAA